MTVADEAERVPPPNGAREITAEDYEALIERGFPEATARRLSGYTVSQPVREGAS